MCVEGALVETNIKRLFARCFSLTLSRPYACGCVEVKVEWVRHLPKKNKPTHIGGEKATTIKKRAALRVYSVLDQSLDRMFAWGRCYFPACFVHSRWKPGCICCFEAESSIECGPWRTIQQSQSYPLHRAYCHHPPALFSFPLFPLLPFLSCSRVRLAIFIALLETLTLTPRKTNEKKVA